MKNLQKNLVIVLLFFGLTQTHLLAQAVELEVGKVVIIGNCKKGAETFEFIDEYARTLALDTTQINRETGEGLLEAFFSDKSIDAHRLPCLHAGKKYKIAAFHTFEVPDPKNPSIKKEQNVMLLYSGYPLTLFWVMIDEAIASGEILIPTR
jgi:hypothetical protein